MRLSENRCVCCGAVIPEGRQVCKRCEVGTDNNVGSMNGLVSFIRREFYDCRNLGFSVGQAKDCMIEVGTKYCRDSGYDISLIRFDDLINEIIVKEWGNG